MADEKTDNSKIWFFKKTDKLNEKVQQQDWEQENKLNEKVQEANEKMKELEAYAKSLGLGVHKKRTRSNVKHVQFIQENWAWINKLPKGHKQRLTGAEKAFLVDICHMVQFGSNCICKKDKNKQESPCNISELSKILVKDRATLNNIINSLNRKGVLCLAEIGIDGVHPLNEDEPHPGKAKMILINPRLIHSGYNNEPNETLKILFKSSLTKVPVKLF